MHRIDPRVPVVIATLVLSAMGGCTATGKNQGQAGGAGSGGAGQGGMATGGDGGGFVLAGAGGNGGGCVADKQQATLVKEPVDLIMVVDTSPTMGPASDSVEKTINENLATALTTENVDYRLIVLAGYGTGAELCISPPLGGAACTPTPPAQPANTSRFFHYVRATGSGALLDNIINWYNAADDIGSAPNGWKEWLRPGAKKVFLIFSDTSSSSSNAAQGDTFDANLLALDAATFGTANDRRYTFHSIIGLRENSPATSPWLPADALVQDTCTGFAISLGAGESLQQVSILSKGLRFPVCQFAGFDVVFQQIAKDVVQKTELACDIPFPTPPAGETIDPDTIQLVYTSGAGMKSTYGQVVGLPDCKPNSFYVEGQVIHLCPASCDTVKVDAMGTIDVQYGCDVGFVK